eukprot:4741918-Prymnesium_polylepis.1
MRVEPEDAVAHRVGHNDAASVDAGEVRPVHRGQKGGIDLALCDRLGSHTAHVPGGSGGHGFRWVAAECWGDLKSLIR